VKEASPSFLLLFSTAICRFADGSPFDKCPLERQGEPLANFACSRFVASMGRRLVRPHERHSKRREFFIFIPQIALMLMPLIAGSSKWRLVSPDDRNTKKEPGCGLS